MFLEVDSLEEIKKKLDHLYRVMILHAMNLDFGLVHVPAPKSGNLFILLESSLMISTHGRGSGTDKEGRGDRGRRPQWSYYKRMSYTLEHGYFSHGFPDKATTISKSKKL